MLTRTGSWDFKVEFFSSLNTWPKLGLSISWILRDGETHSYVYLPDEEGKLSTRVCTESNRTEVRWHRQVSCAITLTLFCCRHPCATVPHYCSRSFILWAAKSPRDNFVHNFSSWVLALPYRRSLEKELWSWSWVEHTFLPRFFYTEMIYCVFVLGGVHSRSRKWPFCLAYSLCPLFASLLKACDFSQVATVLEGKNDPTCW